MLDPYNEYYQSHTIGVHTGYLPPFTKLLCLLQAALSPAIISSMTPERRHIPEWARREREADLLWIGENMPEFYDAARHGFAQFGRGAIAVDTTTQTPPGQGHPIWYLTQDQVHEYGGEDEIRMVAQYDPTWELVAILLKEQDRVSSYRVGFPGQRQTHSR